MESTTTRKAPQSLKTTGWNRGFVHSCAKHPVWKAQSVGRGQRRAAGGKSHRVMEKEMLDGSAGAGGLLVQFLDGILKQLLVSSPSKMLQKSQSIWFPSFALKAAEDKQVSGVRCQITDGRSQKTETVCPLSSVMCPLFSVLCIFLTPDT